MLLSDIVILIGISLALRSMFLIMPRSSDDSVHLWRASQIKKNKSFLKDYKVNNSIIEGYHATPPLASTAISFFPRKHWRLVGKLLNISYDCITVFLVYLFSYLLFLRHFSFDGPGRLAFYVALVFSTTPVFFPLDARMTAIGGRTLGLLFNLLYFIFLGQAFIFNDLVFYLAAFLAGILIIITSQFALQNMILVSFFLSLFYLNFLPFTFTLLVLIIGYALPFIGISKIIRHKFNHYLWYYKNWPKHLYVSKRNKIKEIIKLPYGR